MRAMGDRLAQARLAARPAALPHDPQHLLGPPAGCPGRWCRPVTASAATISGDAARVRVGAVAGGDLRGHRRDVVRPTVVRRVVGAAPGTLLRAGVEVDLHVGVRETPRCRCHALPSPGPGRRRPWPAAARRAPRAPSAAWPRAAAARSMSGVRMASLTSVPSMAMRPSSMREHCALGQARDGTPRHRGPRRPAAPSTPPRGTSRPCPRDGTPTRARPRAPPCPCPPPRGRRLRSPSGSPAGQRITAGVLPPTALPVADCRGSGTPAVRSIRVGFCTT